MNVAVICYINEYIKLNSSATQLNSRLVIPTDAPPSWQSMGTLIFFHFAQPLSILRCHSWME